MGDKSPEPFSACAVRYLLAAAFIGFGTYWLIEGALVLYKKGHEIGWGLLFLIPFMLILCGVPLGSGYFLFGPLVSCVGFPRA